MNTQLIYRQAPDCLLEDMDGTALLFNPANATTLQLNASSQTVWGLCTGEHSVAEIIEALQEAYPDHAEQIVTDVAEVVTELADKGVLLLVDEGATDE